MGIIIIWVNGLILTEYLVYPSMVANIKLIILSIARLNVLAYLSHSNETSQRLSTSSDEA